MKTLCPRCEIEELEEMEALNALSRKDNETYVCSPCGVDEAVWDFMKSKHPLMKNNFTRSDMSAVKKVISVNNLVLTQSKNVRQFEKKWCRWQEPNPSPKRNKGGVV